MRFFGVARGEALVSGADEHRAAERGEGFELLEYLPALLRRLGEAQAGVEYPFADARLVGNALKAAEVVHQGVHDAFRVLAAGVHRAGVAPFVHRYVFEPQAADGRKHLGVVLAGGDVVDDEWPGKGIGAAHDFGAGGVDGELEAAVAAAQHGFKPLPLLLDGYVLRSRAGGDCPEVDDVCALGEQFPYAGERSRCLDPARREEGIRGEVDDCHYLCHSAKVGKNIYICVLC